MPISGINHKNQSLTRAHNTSLEHEGRFTHPAQDSDHGDDERLGVSKKIFVPKMYMYRDGYEFSIARDSLRD